jgi:NADPH-dependent curcumin reductase CurA
MVVASEDPAVPVGAHVATYTGWQSYARPQGRDAGADLTAAVLKRTTLRGYVASDHYPQRLAPVRAELAALLAAGRLRAVVSEFDGLERAPEALGSVFEQDSPYIGKRVVRISDG